MAPVLLAAGCGGGPKVQSAATFSTTRPTTAESATAQLVSFVDCMNSHGFHAALGPGGHGVSITGNFEQGSPQFLAAQKACQKLLPNGVPTAAATARRVRAFLALAACMRKHGFPGFPDPSRDGQLLIRPTNGFNPNTPQFQVAMHTCSA